MTTNLKGRTITVRQIEDRTHRALKERANRNSRSMEAEARKTLTDAVFPEPTTLTDLAALLPDLDDVPFIRSQETFSP